jgi:hypothetical protein
MPYAAPGLASRIDDSTAKPLLTGRVRGVCLNGVAQGTGEQVPRKVPINPDLRPRSERETAGQAPVPYAREAPTSVSMVAGGGFEPPTFGL